MMRRWCLAGSCHSEIPRYVSVCINLYEWVWTGISGLVQYITIPVWIINMFGTGHVPIRLAAYVQWDILNGDVQHTKDLY